MKKRLSALLACLLLVSLLAGCAGQQSADDGTTAPSVPSYEYTLRDLPEAKYLTPAAEFAGGSGTEGDPYQITDAAQLALLQSLLAQDDLGDYWKAYYVLTADIDLNDTTDYANWSTTGPEYQWQPMGEFRGVFDGAGYTIRGLYINANDTDPSGSYFGLFGQVRDGTVKNLILDKAYIEVSGVGTTVGALVGYLSGKTALVENCVSNADIYCYDGTYAGVVGNLVNGSLWDEDHDHFALPTVRDCSFHGTITQVKDGSLSILGGIAGDCEGYLTDCESTGTIRFAGDNVDVVGGIAGWATAGEISGCVHSGTLECAQVENGLARVGGIVGNLFLSATGSEDYMSRGVTVSDCTNTGTVEGADYVGGIVGSASNDHNDWCLTVSGCVNEGSVSGGKEIGGIIGYLTSIGDPDNGSNVVIDGCENRADLYGGTLGGVIGMFYSQTGTVLIQSCSNTGALTTTEQNAGGIIGYWLMDSYCDDTVTLKDCVNTGSVASLMKVGGIVGYMDLPVLIELGNHVGITVSGCENSGDLTVSTINGYLGGILGCWGMQSVPTVVENCTNSGDLHITHVITEEPTGEDPEIVLSRIAGGIVGRTGTGLLLSTVNDQSDASHIQSDKAWLVIRGCENTGTAVLADDREGEFGKAWYQNCLGGIIGSASAEEAYSLRVEDCTYTGFDRGLGSKDLPDVGTKR